jgi:hypothetical protein
MRWLAESLAFSLRGLVSRRPRQSPDPTQSRRRVIYGVNTALGRRQFSQFYLDVLSIIQRLLARPSLVFAAVPGRVQNTRPRFNAGLISDGVS